MKDFRQWVLVVLPSNARAEPNSARAISPLSVHGITGLGGFDLHRRRLCCAELHNFCLVFLQRRQRHLRLSGVSAMHGFAVVAQSHPPSRAKV